MMLQYIYAFISQSLILILRLSLNLAVFLYCYSVLYSASTENIFRKATVSDSDCTLFSSNVQLLERKEKHIFDWGLENRSNHTTPLLYYCSPLLFHKLPNVMLEFKASTHSKRRDWTRKKRHLVPSSETLMWAREKKNHLKVVIMLFFSVKTMLESHKRFL